MKRRKSRTTTKRLKVRDTAEAARAIPWIDVEARHSGDEVSSGESLLEEGESEGDGRFVTDLPATQASPSYDQSAVYRQSLLSQAPVSNMFSVPKFAAPPARRGVPLRGPAAAAGAALDPSLRSHQERARRFSSPPPPDEEDYYMLGSFVVDDEAEISFTQSSEP
jgi:ATP-dependent DNA helicase MPH1